MFGFYYRSFMLSTIGVYFIINYFFSKWFIFNRDAKQPPEKTAEKTADGSCSED